MTVAARLVVGFLAGVALGPTGAEAVWLNLTPTQVQQAIDHGKATFESLRAAGKAIDDLDADYVIDLGPAVGRAMLFTEFSALALEARRWQAIGQTLMPADVERILMPIRGRVQFYVVVIGPSRDHLRSRTVRLQQAGESHAPFRWDVFRGEPAPGDGRRWTAPGYYTFEGATLSPDAPATLLLRDQAGGEIRFDFDLARLR